MRQYLRRPIEYKNIYLEETFFFFLRNYLKSTQATGTEYHSLGGLDNRHLSLIVPKAGKSNLKVLVDLVPAKGPSSGLEGIHLPSVSSVRVPLVIRTLIPSWGSTLMTSCNLVTSQRSHLQIPSHWWFEFQHTNFWGWRVGDYTNIQSIKET